MQKLLWVMLVLVLTVGLILSGCSSTSTPSSTTSAPTTSATAAPTTSATVPTSSQTQKVLKIGAVVPLNMAEGIEIQKWMNLFAKMYNEKGGWKIGNDTYQVQIEVEDGGYSDLAKSRSAAEKLILQDGVKFLVSSWGDIPAQTITITEPNKVLDIGCDFTDGTAAPGLNYFIRGSGVYFGQAMNYVIDKDAVAKGAKTYLVVGPDNARIKVACAHMNATATVAGLNPLDVLYFSSDTVDFSPLATKIKSLNPDVVDLGYTGGDQGLNLMSALIDAGYKGIIQPGNMTQTTIDNAVKKLGKDFMEGKETGSFDPTGMQKDPDMLALIDSYTKEYGSFHSDGCMWVTPWFFFQDAVNSTQSVDVDVLAKYLQNSTHGVKCLTGYAQLFARPDLQNFKTIDVAIGNYVGIIKDGKLVSSKTDSVKDQYLVSIKSYSLVDVYQKYWDQYGKPQFPQEPSLFDFADLTK
ncbi:MAG: ABC transporter substrate-binding protein [Dehalococcoidales bacterium]